MQQLTEKDYKKILVCLTLYLTSLFAANTLGVKLMPFLFGTHLSVGVFSFPIVFIMTDVIGEVYGKKMAKNFVLAGVISILLFLLYSLLSTITPWAEQSLWVKDGSFVIAEYQDIIAFFFFRKHTGEKKFWLRSNLSNIWSQLLDTIIFISVAFVGVYPIKTIIYIIIPWWLFKVLMGFVYTPLSYLGVYLLKGKNEVIAN
ncbi:MAG: hypothetical protein UW02_C0006G0031 [Candidatus Nomurabacteria bacterium GW2011_GWB1_43_7]|uniref:Probable queuosine precursor transporter n=1 Tax=Candidatus Nomurabacteria bacterium GW2011_GWB1_43_7 TaxID=1618747 RepID=A0A0G1FBR9_9BACT|nr:MAG: hypothetical protein UW02_C0006G0031 [Candidatus Nomurabacteria bacterium GW2011_GWB1_43_7]